MESSKKENRISYIRKPMADNSFYSLFSAAAALVLCFLGFGISIGSAGETPMGAISMCFSSILFAIVGLFYGRQGLKEEEKNYILVKIGFGISAVLLIWWAAVLLIGIKGTINK